MTTQIKNTFGIVENGTIKMTSIEIADMVGVRHDNTKRSIERLSESGVIRLPPLENCVKINSLGLNQPYSFYVFEGEQGRLDATILVAQLSPTFTAKLVYRWSELEKEVERLKQISLLPDFNNPAIAARAWADEVDQKIMAQLEARERSEVADAKTLPYPMSHLIGGTNKQAGEANVWLVMNGYMKQKLGAGGKHLGYTPTEKGKDYVVQTSSQLARHGHVKFTPKVLEILPDAYKHKSPFLHAA